jgi:hypothetical protein
MKAKAIVYTLASVAISAILLFGSPTLSFDKSGFKSALLTFPYFMLPNWVWLACALRMKSQKNFYVYTILLIATIAAFWTMVKLAEGDNMAILLMLVAPVPLAALNLFAGLGSQNTHEKTHP